MRAWEREKKLQKRYTVRRNFSSNLCNASLKVRWNDYLECCWIAVSTAAAVAIATLFLMLLVFTFSMQPSLATAVLWSVSENEFYFARRKIYTLFTWMAKKCGSRNDGKRKDKRDKRKEEKIMDQQIEYLLDLILQKEGITTLKKRYAE